MRIVAGEWRGRTINAPAGSTTRPTTDRVRESLFSSLTSLLGPGMGGAHVLDAFAGSGALGLEALSRGCPEAMFVEKDRRALDALRGNVETLGARDRASIRAGDVFALAARGVLRVPFALILLDPPYTLDPAAIEGLLRSLADAGAIQEGAAASWEHSATREASWPAGWRIVNEKRYGDTAIDIAVFERGVRGL